MNNKNVYLLYDCQFLFEPLIVLHLCTVFLYLIKQFFTQYLPDIICKIIFEFIKYINLVHLLIHDTWFIIIFKTNNYRLVYL